jgi:hypothetical protein
MSDRGLRASLLYNIDKNFVQSRRDAEKHRTEMRGWKSFSKHDNPLLLVDADRSYLNYFRALATQKY